MATAKEAGDVIQRQRSDTDGARGEPFGEEVVTDRQTVIDRDRAQATVVAQEGFNPAFNPFHRAPGGIPRGLSRREVAFHARPGQQLLSRCSGRHRPFGE